MATGLRFRIRRAARQMGEQHQHIQAIRRDLDRAVADADPERVRQVFDRYRSALEAHFQLEEEVFFPGLHGLEPEHEAALESLSEEHVHFATELDRLGARLSGEGIAAFSAGFRDLAAQLRQHEAREESIAGSVAALRDEGPAGSPGVEPLS